MKRKHLRGSTSAGRGYGKRARHAGNRGGRGRAGGGKRGQQKMMSINANEHTYNFSSKKKVPLNLNHISSKIKAIEKDGMLKKEGDRIVIDLDELGYSKVCGKFGSEKFKLVIHGKASERAKNEIIAAGGEVL
ncbi:MAG: uL15 family ribosomal protein [Candidatus Parvarchaeota archaeon]|nr:uL15 family ribosomal protein [Candidatus Parvarchaeota archaeon]